MEPVASPFSAVSGPLLATFGDGLTFDRLGNRVRWTYCGLSAVVDLQVDGSLGARFLTRPTLDAARGRSAAGVYRPLGRGYPLTPVGCTRMVDDTIAFFSGAREPRFVFVDVV